MMRHAVCLSVALVMTVASQANAAPAPLTRELPQNACEWTAVEAETMKLGFIEWKQNILTKFEAANTPAERMQMSVTLATFEEFHRNLLANLAACKVQP